MRNKLCTGAASMLLFILSATAQNPIIQTSYTPDPAPLIYNDTMYVYTGDDIPGTDFYYMTKWRVFRRQIWLIGLTMECRLSLNRLNGHETGLGLRSV